MNNLKKLVIIIIRLQGLAIILNAVIHWCIIAVSIIMASLNPNKVVNYEPYLISSIAYLIIGAILLARSKSLANYFIAGVEDDGESEN
ncbi:MAG: hypothetical protein M3T96_06995 [Acidobacteriota bacterium]|nr:hypothetical protein [Acidobacteriota bacterium]